MAYFQRLHLSLRHLCFKIFARAVRPFGPVVSGCEAAPITVQALESQKCSLAIGSSPDVAGCTGFNIVPSRQIWIHAFLGGINAAQSEFSDVMFCVA